MFLKKIFFYTLLIYIVGCSDLRFVYDDSHKNLKDLFENTLVSISGDDSETIRIYIQGKLGAPINRPTYQLIVSSKKEITAAVLDKDATASKIQIKNTSYYSLSNIKKSCVILNKEIETITSYNTKSEGYSFGSDFSENELLEKNLYSNIDMFFDSVILSSINLNCKNEN